jgi:dynein light chain LC8-type
MPLDATSTSTDAASSPKEGATGSGPKAVVKNIDMSDEMQQESIDIASAALEKYSIEKDIAAQIKKEFDRRHGPTWHVVVGKNFGSYVTHGKRFNFQSSMQSRCQASIVHFLHLRFSILIVVRRNQTLHLLLCRVSCLSHLEVIDLKCELVLRGGVVVISFAVLLCS